MLLAVRDGTRTALSDPSTQNHAMELVRLCSVEDSEFKLFREFSLSIGIMTTLRDGRPRKGGSIPDRIKDFCLSDSVQSPSQWVLWKLSSAVKAAGA
jgi:hypothetical protein